MDQPDNTFKSRIPFMENTPSWDVVVRKIRLWRHSQFVSVTNHEEIIQGVIEDGHMTSRYSFMVMMACAIAILGLLLSSPAVIIGAMLISPLMGPIMSLGFSLCIVDFKQMKKSLEAIVFGFTLALIISAAIVYISPLTDATPEIMARTQPNLFDLLVAIFSGLAGGYATIKQKGATIVGVAIATALMPPLAVVGYGLATASWSIAEGAFFLFMTNLLAISLTVTLLAKWYGFGTHTQRKTTFLQTGLVFLVFALLSVPLGFSLSKIAYQSYITKTTKSEINNHFADASSRISNFSISFKADNEIIVDCIMITDMYEPQASIAIQNKLADTFQRKVSLSLDQVIIAKSEQGKVVHENEKLTDTSLTNAVQPKVVQINTQQDMEQSIRGSIFFPLESVIVDTKAGSVSIYPKITKGANLAVFHEVENKLRARFPDWNVVVNPPAQALPFIFFEIGKDGIAEEEASKIDDILWVLRRWNVSEVAVVGFASSVGEFERFDNTSLAYKRAKAVMKLLEGQNLKVVPRAEYLSYAQKKEEYNFGINSFQRVEIRLLRTREASVDVSELSQAVVTTTSTPKAEKELVLAPVQADTNPVE